MSQHVSRRSALKVASGASFVAAWFVAGCSNTEVPKDEIGKAVSLEDSVASRAGVARKGASCCLPNPTNEERPRMSPPAADSTSPPVDRFVPCIPLSTSTC